MSPSDFSDGHWLRSCLGALGSGEEVPVSVPPDAISRSHPAQESLQEVGADVVIFSPLCLRYVRLIAQVRFLALRRRARAGPHAPADAHHGRLHLLHQRVYQLIDPLPGPHLSLHQVWDGTLLRQHLPARHRLSRRDSDDSGTIVELV